MGTDTTLTAGDNLDGGAGDDILRVSSSDAAKNYSAFELKNIETLQVTADNGNVAFDLSGSTGLETLVSRNSDSQVSFNQVTSLVDLEIENLTGAKNTVVEYQDAVVSGTADAVDLHVNNSVA